MTWEPTDEEVRAFRSEVMSRGLDGGDGEPLHRLILRAAWAVSPGPGLAALWTPCDQCEAERARSAARGRWTDAWKCRACKGLRWWASDDADAIRAALAPLGGEPSLEPPSASPILNELFESLTPEPAPDPRDEVVAAAKALVMMLPVFLPDPQARRALLGLIDALAKAKEVRGE